MSPLDYQIDALLRTLDACERTRRNAHCALYRSQLVAFSNDYAQLFPSADMARALKTRARYYELIDARSCEQIKFDADRDMLNQLYGPVGAARRVLRRYFST